jgi:hypothetical protein
VADDDGAGAGILEHLRRDIAGEGARRLGAAILRADPHWAAVHGSRKLRQQSSRRAHQQVDGWELRRAFYDSRELGQRAAQPVHLPVAGNERSARCHPR